MDYIDFKDSKNLKFVLYNENTNTLYVYFKNLSLYKYMNFTKKDFDLFKNSKEHGKYFYENIRNVFEYKSIY